MTPADSVLDRILAREGGISDIGDGAGETRFGQTDAWLSTFGLTAPATPDEARANYQAWLVKTKLDQACTVADSLSDCLVDWAVNSGHTLAIRSLQLALGTRPDGVLGSQTLTALALADRGKLARKVLADRVRFIGGLITDHPAKYARWARGWANRMAKQIEVIG